MFLLRANYGFVLRRVFERSKSEKNEATLTPSRAHVIGGGGEGVCAVTDEEKTTVPLTETSEEGGANEIAFVLSERFFVVVV